MPTLSNEEFNARAKIIKNDAESINRIIWKRKNGVETIAVIDGLVIGYITEPIQGSFIPHDSDNKRLLKWGCDFSKAQQKVIKSFFKNKFV